MSWIEDLQKVVPWVAGQPLLPKLIISLIVVAIGSLFLLLVWTPPAVIQPSQNVQVIESFNRMKRVLGSLQRRKDGTVVYGSTVVAPERAAAYYGHYLAIGEFVKSEPENIQGAYEKVWEHGGAGRVFTSDTEALESVVHAFFEAYENAKTGKQHPK